MIGVVLKSAHVDICKEVFHVHIICIDMGLIIVSVSVLNKSVTHGLRDIHWVDSVLAIISSELCY